MFDRKFYLSQQIRSRHLIAQHDFIYQEVFQGIQDRLQILNKNFDKVFIFGYIASDVNQLITSSDITHYLSQNGDDEETLPNFINNFDLIISNLSLHYVNKLPQVLLKYNRILSDNAVFIATLFGGETLKELRWAMQEAELQLFCGVSPRVIPMIQLKDAAHLMQQVGFYRPVVDIESIIVHYDDLKSLLYDIKVMGQSNALLARNTRYLGKEFFAKVENFYQTNSSHNNKLVATFEVITMTGMKNHK